jgi:tankyrase
MSSNESTASSNSRAVRSTSLDTVGAVGDPHRGLFDACRGGDIASVRQFVTRDNINAADISGRRSTPLHFAAG